MNTTIFVSINVNKELLQQLQTIGQVLFVPELEKTYTSINTHPDIQLSVIKNKLFVDKDAWDNIVKINDSAQLDDSLKPIILTTNLGNRYPLSVPFNGKFLDNKWIHHLEYTNKDILGYIEEEKITCIHTNQGYSGCSLLLLPGMKGITSDPGIAKTLITQGFEILLIREGYIFLDGLNHGFIGGCCGYYKGTVYVHGDLTTHPEGNMIREFISDQELAIVEIDQYPLTDIGSILFYEGGSYE